MDETERPNSPGVKLDMFLGIRITGRLKELLQQEAKRDDRSMSNVAKSVLEAWAKSRDSAVDKQPKLADPPTVYHIKRAKKSKP